MSYYDRDEENPPKPDPMKAQRAWRGEPLHKWVGEDEHVEMVACACPRIPGHYEMVTLEGKTIGIATLVHGLLGEVQVTIRSVSRNWHQDPHRLQTAIFSGGYELRENIWALAIRSYVEGFDEALDPKRVYMRVGAMAV